MRLPAHFIFSLPLVYALLRHLDAYWKRCCPGTCGDKNETPSMAKPRNFLKLYRRRAGLTQAEAAILTGSRNRLQFARYERHFVDPPLRTAVACEQVFGVPISELFAGLNAEVNATTLRRTRRFKERLGEAVNLEADNRGLAHKLEWITERLASWLIRKPLQAL